MTRKTHESPREIVVIVDGDSAELAGERGALLDRMLGAIGLDRTAVRVETVRQGHDGAPARAILAFGRGLADSAADTAGRTVVVTRSLGEVIADPALKREVWGDLQRFARAAGLPAAGPKPEPR